MSICPIITDVPICGGHLERIKETIVYLNHGDAAVD
jgi:hypothetical protein